MSLKIEPIEDWQEILADILEIAGVQTTPEVQAALLTITVPEKGGARDAWTLLLAQIRARNVEWAAVPAPTLDALRQVRDAAYQTGYANGEKAGAHAMRHTILTTLSYEAGEAANAGLDKQARRLRRISDKLRLLTA